MHKILENYIFEYGDLNLLSKRFREVMLDGTWIANTNFKQQLTGLNLQVATTRRESLNSIAMLAQHINYYIEGINNVFNGGSLDIKDIYSFSFPPVLSQQQWEDFLTRLWENTEVFASHINGMDNLKFNQPFVDEKYGTYQRNIEGMIEHCYYHLGQIVLLKKMIIADKNTGNL